MYIENIYSLFRKNTKGMLDASSSSGCGAGYPTHTNNRNIISVRRTTLK